MATKSEKERLAVIEEQMKQNIVEHKEIKGLVVEVAKDIKDIKENTASKQDLKEGLATKADLEDFHAVKNNQKILNTRLWAILIFIITALFSALGWTIRQLWLIKGGLN